METQLDSQADLQRLLARQSEIQRAMRRPGGIRITVERELYAIREQLKRYPTARPSQAAEDAAADGSGVYTPHAPHA